MPTTLKMKWKSLVNIGHPSGSADSSLTNSSPSMNPETKEESIKNVRIRVSKILLRHKQNLLVALSQGTFVGETAAAISTSTISLLQTAGPETCQKFMMRMLRTKILIYTSKNRKITDLLRDNSISTMLLGAFARYVGQNYIISTLQRPIEDALKSIAATELTLSKQPNGESSNRSSDTTGDTPCLEVITAAQTILNAIFESIDTMPLELCSVCSYLKEQVDQVLTNPSITVKMKNEIRNSISSPSGPPNFWRPGERRSMPKSPSRLSQANYTADISEENLEKPSTNGSTNVNVPKESKTTEQTGPRLRAGSAGSHERGDSLNRSMTVPRDFKQAVLDAEGKEKEAEMIPNDPMSGPLSVLSDPGAMIDGEKSIRVALQTLPSRDEVHIFTETSTSATSTKSEEDPLLTMPERVVGTFLFLRFYVPAVTAPESYKLQTGKVDPHCRKKMILLGKILNGFCSEADFRQKDASLMAAFDFLNDNKLKVKTFLKDVTEKDQMRAQLSGAAENEEMFKNCIIDENFVQHLAKSVSRLEKDLPQILELFPKEYTEFVMNDFEGLKKELRLYTQLTEPPPKPLTFFERIHRRFGSRKKVANYPSKSKSSDDLARSPSPERRQEKSQTSSAVSGIHKSKSDRIS